ncbi:MAG: transketolase [Polyangiaceae bacterium]|jgi:transketolase|nr:transketolase [Polyangiaceae bacterium]MBK8940231.1 transketolase [Polyangiaceae bacterium]
MSTLAPASLAQAVATVRMLSVDGVEKAQSGHPGTPMALADITLDVWLRHLRYDPSQPSWADRDRFVLSCGHASMLLYSMLHLAGYGLTLDDLRAFRQWGSKTPGHPESHLTEGVETTTGPLGQGISNGVGMALGFKMRAARAGRPGLVGARVFGIASDGDLMEGVSSEASSLAGHLGLDNLIFFYDDNKITIDGDTDLAFSEDVAKRYQAYGWATWTIDGHDHAQIQKALDEAVALVGKPKLIVAKTRIGIGAPTKEGSHKAHGEPLGAAEVKGTKEKLGWPVDQTFVVPEAVYAMFRERAAEGRATRERWEAEMSAFAAADPAGAAAFKALLARAVPANLFEELLAAAPKKEAATRVSAGIVEQRAAALVPSLVGGSADLNPSTKTFIEGSPAVKRGEFAGRNIHFGIREHGMGAVMNGMAATEGFIPFGSTFLVFADYMRPTIRLAALSHLQSVFVFTHDSLYLGEDGPTHQPVEHVWALRLIPNVDVMRPADPLECAAAWTHALTRTDGPTVMALTRQNVPVLARPEGFEPKTMLQGGYVLADAQDPTLVIVATGSEVSIAVEAKALLDARGERVRVVSMPCLEAFSRQADAYRDAVLPPSVPRVVIELGVSRPWRDLVGATGLVIGFDRFGHSAPAKRIAQEIGFVPDAVAATIRAWRRGSD